MVYTTEMASSENDGSCNVISGGDRSYGQT